jgi:O-antigen/teichoic acid export membrane protein
MGRAGLSLSENFAWSLAGNVSYAASQWLAIVALARIGDTGMVGAYSLALAISSPIFLLVNLHLRTVQATDVNGRFRLEDYLGLRLLTVVLALAAMGLVSAFGPFGELTRLVLIPVALTRASESISDIVYGHCQLFERMDSTGRSMVARAAGTLAAMCLMLASGAGLVASVSASMVFSAAVTVLDVRLLRGETGAYPAPDFRTGPLRSLVSASFALALIMALSSLSAGTPRLLLARWQPESEVGIFSALALLPVSANIMVLALGQAAAPVMSRACVRGDWEGFRRAAWPLGRLAGLLALAGLAGALWAGGQLVNAVYGPDYARHGEVITLLFIGGSVSYLNAGLGYILSSARWFRQQIGPLAAVASSTAVFCAVLIPKMGMKGAALAQLGGSVVQLLLSIVVVTLCLREHFREVRLA